MAIWWDDIDIAIGSAGASMHASYSNYFVIPYAFVVCRLSFVVHCSLFVVRRCFRRRILRGGTAKGSDGTFHHSTTRRRCRRTWTLMTEGGRTMIKKPPDEKCTNCGDAPGRIYDTEGGGEGIKITINP